ncbi:thermonuclease family protein [Microbacterium sp. CCNWLW134]|uniref:thermonuclease family protein n=1 Tax=Microbacterium sp. CCNWLW134 TaxID=3122064 RepID=UPI00301035DC
MVVGILLSPIFAVIFLVILITGIVAMARNTPTWLRFPSRKAATWITVASAIGFFVTGSIANAVMNGAGNEDSVAVAEEAPTSTPKALAAPIQSESPTPTPTEQSADLVGVVDGDTITTSAGDVRLIGIDAPEQGVWGHDEAKAELAAFLGAGPLTMVPVEGRDDKDQYGRLLRYVRVNGQDAGAHMVQTGWAIAKYDSRDNYGGHPLEGDYVASDAVHEMPPQPAPEPPPAPAASAPAPAAPAPAPEPAAPATDPQFGTCGEANDNGYGNYQQGVDVEYGWYQDRDKDGWVCEF